MTELKNLFQPGKIGKIGTKNRLVMLPLSTGYNEPDGTVGDRMINFFAEREALALLSSLFPRFALAHFFSLACMMTDLYRELAD